MIGSPLFDKVEIKRKSINGGFCYFRLLTYRKDKKDIYVKYIFKNGEILPDPGIFFDHLKDFKCND